MITGLFVCGSTPTQPIALADERCRLLPARQVDRCSQHSLLQVYCGLPAGVQGPKGWASLLQRHLRQYRTIQVLSADFSKQQGRASVGSVIAWLVIPGLHNTRRLACCNRTWLQPGCLPTLPSIPYPAAYLSTPCQTSPSCVDHTNVLHASTRYHNKPCNTSPAICAAA